MPSQDDLQALWAKLEGRRIATHLVLLHLLAYLARESGEPDLMVQVFLGEVAKDLERQGPHLPRETMREALDVVLDTREAVRLRLGLEAMLQDEPHSPN